MNSPVNEEVQALMEAAHDRAAKALGLTCAGLPRILPFGDDAAQAYADVLVARERAGLPIGMADAQIAAICRVNGAMCATRNVKDFEETGVELIDPWS